MTIKNNIAKIDARLAVTAKTYESLMGWAKKIYDMPQDASSDISDFYNLPQDQYEIAIAAGLQEVVIEHEGMKTVRDILA